MRLSHVILIFLLFFLQCQFPTVRMDSFEVHGIDVSHHQSRIHWDSVVAEDVHFAFLKATEGGDWLDSLYCFNWSEAERVGLKRGAYHFYRPGRSPWLQASNFMQQVHLEVGDLPPVLDVEVTDGIDREALIEGMKIWLMEVEMHFNVKPIIYTNLKFYYQYLAGHFDDYPLWIARYRDREPKLAAGKDWDFWQYGNRGEMPGINGDVDFNVFHGSIEELESYCVKPNVFSFGY
ncbi:MAG: glycoside hydrolase family 25 protein [Bacteroidetes bacterium]|nr:glycoside hydrolase family 25 protein [Bacteroidota bacterium]